MALELLRFSLSSFFIAVPFHVTIENGKSEFYDCN